MRTISKKEIRVGKLTITKKIRESINFKDLVKMYLGETVGWNRQSVSGSNKYLGSKSLEKLGKEKKARPTRSNVGFDRPEMMKGGLKYLGPKGKKGQEVLNKRKGKVEEATKESGYKALAHSAGGSVAGTKAELSKLKNKGVIADIKKRAKKATNPKAYLYGTERKILKQHFKK
jgi:hypothetical protein